MTYKNSNKVKLNENGTSVSLEEIVSDGTGSGLEAERQPDDSGDISAPFDPKQIDVITQQRTVDLIMTRLEHAELDLSPDFQRRANLWNVARKSTLIESILLRIPIPSLYVAEDDDGNYQVVDGLQRLCAIAHFVNVASLNKALNIKLNPLRLHGLQSLKSELDDTSFDDLPRTLKRRIMETELTLHVIRAGTPLNVKFNIFSRINQGGLPLNAQEIRNAIYRGKWRDYVRQMVAHPSFLAATENRIKGERLEDHELVLRFAALYTLPREQKRHPDENLDDFLNNFVEKRTANWSDTQWEEVVVAFQRAMVAAPLVFGRMAFRKYSQPNSARHPINRGLFETEAVAIARLSDEQINKLANKSDEVIEKFGNKFSTDAEFVNSLLYATGRGSSSNKRLETLIGIFNEALNA